MPKDTIEAKIGSYAPDFRLQATDGREITLSDFRGRANVILFFIREYS
jgi:peroxiredoxin